jgi:uncharacterized protein (DUF4415 family)
MKKERIVKYTQNNLPEDTQTDWQRLAAMTDQDIDKAISTDPDAAPILGDDFWKTAKIVMPGEAGKARITIRVDSDVLKFFKGMGNGYQKRINAVLRAYMQAHD